jgi:hypothetical protein
MLCNAFNTSVQAWYVHHRISGVNNNPKFRNLQLNVTLIGDMWAKLKE